ncbi:hypothetical protein [Streptosporangium canum]|uniref:hypothetical protein n=1 Tax=Streptosporangium canum TaxID=324952 RepID=UPI0015A69B5E|nr:hypothetical protein [Streptosporangium canum]
MRPPGWSRPRSNGWSGWCSRSVSAANRFFVGFGGKTRDGFAEGLQRIGRELGCPVRLL